MASSVCVVLDRLERGDRPMQGSPNVWAPLRAKAILEQSVE
jgi:hypothetical protein